MSYNDELEEKLISVFQSTLRLADVPRDTPLRDIGLDGPMAKDVAVQLKHLLPNLQDNFVIDPRCTLASLLQTLRSPASPPITAGGASTVSTSVSDLLANVSEAMMQAISSNPEIIHHAPGRMPLMLIHDGGGTAFAYHALRNLDRSVIGIHCTGLSEGKGIVNVMHAAHEYAAIGRKYLEQNSPAHTKLLIGGWSLGGNISLTMAALYPDLVSGVVVIDSTPPGASGMNVEQSESVLLHRWPRTDGIHGLVRRQLQLNTRALFAHPEYKTTFHAVKVPVYILCAMEPFPTPASLQLPESASTWLLSSKRPQIAEVAWKALLGECLVGVEAIPGNHWTLFTPANRKATEDALRRGLDAIECYNS